MRQGLIISVCFFISAFLFTENSFAQQTKLDSLRREIRKMKSEIVRLEAELDSLQPKIKNRTGKKPKTELLPYKDLKNWRSLEIGMKQDKVKNILGEPTRITAGKYSTIWWYEWGNGRYRIGQLSFDSRKILVLWVEP